MNITTEIGELYKSNYKKLDQGILKIGRLPRFLYLFQSLPVYILDKQFRIRYKCIDISENEKESGKMGKIDNVCMVVTGARQ